MRWVVNTIGLIALGAVAGAIMAWAEGLSLQKQLAVVLAAIVFFGISVLLRLENIDNRLKERFPTEKEEDYRWSQADPAGHYEAHKHDRK